MSLGVRQARQMIDLALAEVVSHRWLILKFFLLSFVILAPYAFRFADGSLRDAGKFYLFLAIGLCLLGIASRAAFLLICLLLLAPALVYQHLSRYWGGRQLDARFEAFYESPLGEIRQYLQNHVDIVDIAFLVGAAVYLIVLLHVVIRQGNRSRLLGRMAAVAVIVWLSVFIAFRLDRRLEAFPPFVLAVQAIEAQDRYKQLSGRNDFLRRHPLTGGSCHSRYDKIVIVIGESVNSDHLGVFGYEKPTTPFAVRSSPHAFDALAPSSQTRYSLGMMLTDAGPGSFDGFCETHSLVGQLRNCGFHTLWISNQGRRGISDSFSASLADEAHEQLFLNEWSWTDAKLDGQIVEELDARGVYAKTGHATFVHLIGSHTEYGERYPEGFGFPNASNVVSQYDNSILYTDHVLSELYDRFSGGSLLFIYVSDHGQMVSNSKFGSGYLPGFKEEFRTPLLIWTEDDSAIDAVRHAIGNSRVNLESFDDIVRFLIGMSTKLKISTRQSVSVLTPEYIKNYDELASLPAE